MPIFLLLVLCTSITTTISSSPYGHHSRHLLHQPFFPLDSFPPTQAPSSAPLPQPQKQQPKRPFSTSSSSPPERPFFPTYHSPPPPPSPTALTSFPANISSLLFPQPTSHPHRHVVAIAVSVSLLSAGLLAALAAAFIYCRRHRDVHSTTDDKTSRSDSLRLFPPNTATSDGAHKSRTTPNTSTEFLYLGTLVNSRGVDQENAANSSNAGVKIGVAASPYQKLGSPELRPLPPLPKHNFRRNQKNSQVGSDEEEEEEEFFSPRSSSGSPGRTGSSSQREYQSPKVENIESLAVDNFGSRSFNSRTPSYPCSKSPSPTTWATNSSSPLSNSSSKSTKSKSPEPVISFLAPSRPASPSLSSSSSGRVSVSSYAQNSPSTKSDVSEPKKQSFTRTHSVHKQFVPVKLPPPPPPLPPARFWEIPAGPRPNVGPPVHVTPSKQVSHGEQLENNLVLERNEETSKPKLKPLHWDKVRASSDRAMVWDQLKSSSFQLNEEMIESLFMANNVNLIPKDNNGRRQIMPSLVQENRVLDPKKSQNIAILLRALNVTIDEVCEALLEGNADSLGTELLESLLKMAPTKEEERKLKEYKDESPFKLGPAEKFLKAVLDIPFAFKRVEALLYIANFDSEVDYLKRSFETLEVACAELRNSRMFMKLLEAVLKTGNRMNVGTNRGDAHAFKLDTLLKLVDIKGTDGKTTLLHFVVQEIIRAEGLRLSGANAENTQQSSYSNDVEFRKLGLQVVSGLSGELTNVKKAAAMDSDVLIREVVKLSAGMTKIAEVLKLNEEIATRESGRKFSESMNGFIKKAEGEMVKLQTQEEVSLSQMKEITAYFHGNSGKEEAHPFRIFMVVRDFLSILDQVCKEVGKINERSTVGLGRQFPMATTPMPIPVFPGLDGRQHNGSSSSDDDDVGSPSSS
ncbi:hypothetical protein UlMin_015985 [Ulmus minor]